MEQVVKLKPSLSVHSSRNIIQVIISRRQSGQMACPGKRRNRCMQGFGGKSSVEKPLGRPGFKWDYLTPWRRVLLGKLKGSQPVEKFPAFYGTRRFITAFTTVRHMSLF
jgi:hypothetical protein